VKDKLAYLDCTETASENWLGKLGVIFFLASCWLLASI